MHASLFIFIVLSLALLGSGRVGRLLKDWCVMKLVPDFLKTFIRLSFGKLVTGRPGRPHCCLYYSAFTTLLLAFGWLYAPFSGSAGSMSTTLVTEPEREFQRLGMIVGRNISPFQKATFIPIIEGSAPGADPRYSAQGLDGRLAVI